MSKPVVTEEDVRQALMDVIDPELGFNIVDLGLIYGVTVEDDKVDIVMTMTTPGCPASLYLQEGTRQRVLAVPGVAEVNVTVVWSPPWTPDMMSDRAKRFFGLVAE